MSHQRLPEPGMQASVGGRGRRWRWFRRGSLLPDPQVTYTGPVAVWWIPKPAGPRVSLRTAGITWFLAVLVLAGTTLLLQAQSKPLWPFGRRISSAAEIAMRYELILLVCLVYVTVRSCGVWLRCRRLARVDARAVDRAIQAERWELAALLLHRYCLLMSAVWRRVPAQAGAWDSMLSRRLPRHRRLYVYYRGDRPALPTDVTASFALAVVPPPQPSLWSAVGLIPVAFLLYGLLFDIVQRGHWQRAILFNAVLLGAVLVGYGLYFFMALLGRSHYFRFAPGVMQLVKFTVGRRRPVIETFDLRRLNAVLDLSSPWPGLTLLNTGRYRRETFRLPTRGPVLEALFRASLSTAPSPPLPEDQLVA